MTTPLRPYQTQLAADVRTAWSQGAPNVMMEMATGGGKTVVLADLNQGPGAKCIIAHRQELLGQLSLALARNGLYHDLIAPDAVKRQIARLHAQKFGRLYFAPGAPTRVAGVDTLVKRLDELRKWASSVEQWTVDEGHHVVMDNKWHTATQLFPSTARGLLPTATPQRADGKGLGRQWDGVADVMVHGPPMRWLIEAGYLCDYRIICPPSDMELLDDDIGASGDWSTAKLRAAAKASHIVGDVVSHYQRWAPGRLGVTFCPDTETAAEIHQGYMAAGVRAGLLTGKTDDGVRAALIARFEAREIMQLVVVDIVSEGFDLPAIEVVSFARKTASLPTYMQQFGRDLRPIYADGFSLATREGRLAAIAASCKPRALVIDHVGNFVRPGHGPPDRPRQWSLARRERRSGTSTGIPLRICLGCWQPYERIYKVCPYCGEAPPAPEGRGSPRQVDGDLIELDPAVLARLRGEVAAIDMSLDAYREQLTARRAPPLAVAGHVNTLAVKQDAQRVLRAAMGRWGHAWRVRGDSDSAMQRRFYLTYGVDVLTAQTLGTVEALALAGRIDGAG